MEFIFSYIAVIFAFQLFVMRHNAYPLRDSIIASYIWPIALAFILLVFIIDQIGWDIDGVKSNKFIGFRKPQHNWPGFAITVFWIEFQFWKKRLNK